MMDVERKEDYHIFYGYPNTALWNACFANACLSFLVRLSPMRTKRSDWMHLHQRLRDYIKYGSDSRYKSPPNLEMIVTLGFPGGRQECAQEFCSLWFENSLKNGVVYSVYWNIRTTTFCDLLPKVGSYKDSLDSMIWIDKYQPMLGLAFEDLWTRRYKLNGNNKFAVTLNGKEVAKVDAEQRLSCIHVPDIAIVALKFRIMGRLKNIPNKEKYAYSRLSLQGSSDIDIALECGNTELVSALIESLATIGKKKREFEHKLNFSQEFVLEKNCNYMAIPLEINFTNQSCRPTHSLHAAVVHSGLPGCGHYWTYIRFVDPMDSKQWFMVNDKEVSKVNEEVVLETIAGGRSSKNGEIINNQPVAYILCFIRTSQISKFIL